MSIENSQSQKLLLLIGDLICILAAYVSAFYIRYFDFPAPNWQAFMALLPVIMVIGVFLVSVYELHILDRKQPITNIVRKILVAVSMMTFLTMAGSYFFRAFAMPRSVIIISSIFMVVYLTIFKIVYIKLTRKNVPGNVLLIGNERNTKKLIAKINDPMIKGKDIKHINENVGMKKIKRALNESDYIIVCTDISKEVKSQVIYYAMEHNKLTYVIPTLYELVIQGAAISPLDDTLVMGIKPFGMTWDKVFIKRLFDLVSSLIILVIISPLLLFVSIIVKIEDPKGKIIYSQERLGKKSKPFTIYKFRSMVSDAETNTGPVLSTTNDDRITKVGRFIRSSRLDELPQLFNVIKGDMSLVGPRPEREFFINKLLIEHYHYGYRNRVKPGITGYAQVMGKYSTEVEDKLRFDLYYIRKYSLWLDIIIILKTILVIFDKSKSEGTNIETLPSKENNKKKINSG